MEKVNLTQGMFAIVDEEDFEEINKYKWHLSHEYAARSIDKRPIFMHRIIMNTPKGMDTDHINHNKLDNRRCNLRICTTKENQHNRKSCKDSSSIYKGVSWDRFTNTWRASIKIDNKRKTIGRFTTEESAAGAYNHFAREYFGSFALLNNVHGDWENFKYIPATTSNYKGVSWNKKYSKWKAEIYYNGKNHFIGLFESEEEAAIKYNEQIVENKLIRKLNSIIPNKN
ncbi:HNH endonuclease [Paenibacillus odorifer]|uniref:HNH endonuclease n=1 Tax=Paenibacillus odorifer TaxID=189426 RepID=UPI00096D1BF0|nr:AP2 domain-containing protein [Paenibacillus odorifer]OMD76880.1 hypothetical protein BSK50_14105 [Paenibacillus odorifer]